MIVEDCLIQSTVLRKILESEQFRVTNVYSSGLDAINGVDRDHPNLILMDVYLNGNLNGYETAKKIREKYDIPFVFVTAVNDSELSHNIQKLDHSTLLPKPVSRKELLNAIDRVMSSVHIA